MTALEVLFLKGNDLESLSPNQFSGLINLQALWLGNNNFNDKQKTQIRDVLADREGLKLTM